MPRGNNVFGASTPSTVGPSLAGKLVLGRALDQNGKAAAAVHEVQGFLEADPFGCFLQLLVADFEQEARQMARR